MTMTKTYQFQCRTYISMKYISVSVMVWTEKRTQDDSFFLSLYNSSQLARAEFAQLESVVPLILWSVSRRHIARA